MPRHCGMGLSRPCGQSAQFSDGIPCTASSALAFSSFLLKFSSRDFFEEDLDELVALIGPRQLLLQSAGLAAGHVVRVQLQVPLLSQQRRRRGIGIFIAGSFVETFAVFSQFVHRLIHFHAVVGIFLGCFLNVSQQLLSCLSLHFSLVKLKPLERDIVEPQIVLPDRLVVTQKGGVLTRSLRFVLPSHFGQLCRSRMQLGRIKF